MLREVQGVKSGDEAKPGSLGQLLVDDLLRVMEAAAALRFAAVHRVRRLGRAGTLARGFADFVLIDGIADADDHGDRYNR